MKKDEEKNILKESNILSSMINPKPSKEDPDGSYTGVPVEYGEKPVQDADDL